MAIMQKVTELAASDGKSKKIGKIGERGEQLLKSYITEEEYNNYLRSQQYIPNILDNVARENPDESIFDAMIATEDEFSKKIYDGESLNDIFKSLIQ
jgi:hypothetical protein